jgi:hypothetical protein
MKTMQQSLNYLVLLAVAAVVVASTSQDVRANGISNDFTQTNLVSDIPGLC